MPGHQQPYGIRPLFRMMLVCCFLLLAFGDADNQQSLSAVRPNASQPKREPVSLTRSVQRLQSATVRIYSDGDRCSGVVIAPGNIVLTVAHGLPIPDSDRPTPEITVLRGDGRRTTAEIVCHNSTVDVAVLQLNGVESSPWPALEIPASAVIPVSDSQQDAVWLLAAGFPARESGLSPAVIRFGRQIQRNERLIQSTCMLTAGDSGGPLVDLNGRLLGIHRRIGLANDSNHHLPLRQIVPVIVPWIQSALPDESAPVDESAPDGTNAMHTVPQSMDQFLTSRLQELTVHITASAVDDGTEKIPVDGTVVRSQQPGRSSTIGTLIGGLHVAAKLSELPTTSSFRCQVGDGSPGTAELVVADRRLDIAILRLQSDPHRLSTADFPEIPGNTALDAGTASATVGLLVVTACADSPDTVCTGLLTRVGHMEPSATARLGAQLVPGEHGGLVVQEVVPGSAAAAAGLRIGDVIQSVDGVPMHSLDTLSGMLEVFEPGDRLSFAVQRGDRLLTLHARLLPDAATEFQKSEFLDGRVGPLSSRRTGFDRTLQHDVPVLPKHCGSPLLDTAGRLIGINIARRAREATLAISIDQVLPLIPAAHERLW